MNFFRYIFSDISHEEKKTFNVDTFVKKCILRGMSFHFLLVIDVVVFVLLADVKTVGKLHSSEHDIRFEDFFWNGSGDEPLTLSLKSNARLTAVNGFVGRETFIKTATVIATVYIDDSVIEYTRIL